jgi:hypothetical protein
METKSIDLDPETIKQLEQLEQSITYWSRRYGTLSLQVDQAKVQLVGMYDARRQLFDEIVQKNDFPKGTRIVEILESGEVKIAIPDSGEPSDS